MSDARALYHATIVDRDRHPRHEAALPAATHAGTADNPLCGDVVTMRFVITGDVIADAAFEARGCSLCRAASDLLAARAVGMTPAAIRALATAFEHFVRGDGVIGDLGELAVFEGVRAFKSRRACASLPFAAALAALGQGR